MKKFTRILIMLFLSCSTLTAQQITQQFTFTQNDLQISQSEGFDIVTLTQDDYLNGEIYAGKLRWSNKTGQKFVNFKISEP